MQRAAILLTLVLFGTLTAAALWQDGYIGIFAIARQSFAGAQLFADLLIALVLVLIWLWQDARHLGRSTWPWVIATLALGAFGPLLYLLTRQPRESHRKHVQERAASVAADFEAIAERPQKSVGADLSASAEGQINGLRDDRRQVCSQTAMLAWKTTPSKSAPTGV